MDEKDLFITPLYLILIYLGAFWYRTKIKDQVLKKYFIPALTAKIIGAICFSLIFSFYYGYGDTFMYYDSATTLHNIISNKDYNIDLLFLDTKQVEEIINQYSNRTLYMSESSHSIVTIATFISFITLNSYLLICIFFSLFSFFGLWSIYKIFTTISLSINYQKTLTILILFMPSTIFWSSGLLKDPISLGSLCFIFSSFYNLFFVKKHNSLFSILVLIINSFLLIKIKAYIFISFFPLILLFLTLEYKNKIKIKTIRLTILPLLIIINIIGISQLLSKIMEKNNRFNLNNLSKSAQYQAFHIQKISKKKSSYYEIGNFDGTLLNTLKTAPNAIFISLFRPFPWESKNPVMLLSGIESFAILILSLYIWLKIGIFKTFNIIWSKPIILCFSLFILVFGIAVALTSGNFGTLVRYRIPLIPFYSFILVYLLSHLNLKELK